MLAIGFLTQASPLNYVNKDYLINAHIISIQTKGMCKHNFVESII